MPDAHAEIFIAVKGVCASRTLNIAHASLCGELNQKDTP